MVKNALANPNFDKKIEHEPYIETEKKLMPVLPERLDRWRQEAKPIEQIYLSHPSEDFSLRLRESFDTNESAVYTATIKNRGEHTDQGLRRFEVSTEISRDCYEFYRSQNAYPTLKKLRASPMDSVDIDFYEDGHGHIEFENTASANAFLQQYPIQLVDITRDHIADNEWRAHLGFRRKANGQEALVPPHIPSFDELGRELAEHYEREASVTMTIKGRSGSGKSTIIRKIKDHINEIHPKVSIITLSTDDYHRGKTWLDNYNNGTPWSDWDAEIVYDLEALQADLIALKNGTAIPKRRFDFTTQESEIVGSVAPSPIIIVEGLYAGSPLLNGPSVLSRVIDTPLATCIGRRLIRDAAAGRMEAEALGTPEAVLRYLLENAEPSYRAQASVS